MVATEKPASAALPPRRDAAWYAPRVGHGLVMLALVACLAGIAELRTTALGVPVVLVLILGSALLILDDVFVRPLARFRGRRRPLLTLTAIAGVVILGCAAFGLVECFYAPISPDPVWTAHLGSRPAPIGRWFFLEFGLFGGLAVYGAVTLAAGTGLLGPRRTTPMPD